MVFNYFLANGLTNPGPIMLFPRVKTLENAEDSLEILGTDADPVIGSRQDQFVVSGSDRDGNPRRTVWMVVFQSIPDKVLY